MQGVRDVDAGSPQGWRRPHNLQHPDKVAEAGNNDTERPARLQGKGPLTELVHSLEAASD